MVVVVAVTVTEIDRAGQCERESIIIIITEAVHDQRVGADGKALKQEDVEHGVFFCRRSDPFI